MQTTFNQTHNLHIECYHSIQSNIATTSYYIKFPRAIGAIFICWLRRWIKVISMSNSLGMQGSTKKTCAASDHLVYKRKNLNPFHFTNNVVKFSGIALQKNISEFSKLIPLENIFEVHKDISSCYLFREPDLLDIWPGPVLCANRSCWYLSTKHIIFIPNVIIVCNPT